MTQARQTVSLETTANILNGLRRYSLRWLSARNSDGHCDMQKVEELFILRTKYFKIKHKKVLWTGGPEEFWKKVWENIWFMREPSRNKLRESLNARLWEKSCNAGPHETVNDIAGRTRDQSIQHALVEILENRKWDKLDGILFLPLEDQDFAPYYDCIWKGVYDFSEGELNLLNYYKYIIEAFESGLGVYFPAGDTIVGIPTPKYSLDEQGRIHSQDGPALEWPDGTTHYLWHGIEVPESVIMNVRSITPKMILEISNTELRRIVIEQYGYREFLSAIPSKIIDSSEKGILRHVYLPSAYGQKETLAVVEVKDATNEEETFFIPVHSMVRKVGEAIASTFGMTADEYNPEVET